MKNTLQIAKDFRLPLDFVTETAAILGIRGSGKTNTGVVLSEELLKQGQQVVVIDPLDVWWGLRSSHDGKSKAFGIPIFGGPHADVPLEGPAYGAQIAEFIVSKKVSAVISMRHFSLHDQRGFATRFAERLYELKGQAANKTPLMLMVDEADEFVPQRIAKGHERLFGAFDRLVRRGRNGGIGITLISQRPQVINKDVLTQVEVLFGMRLIHALDRSALEAWIPRRFYSFTGNERTKKKPLKPITVQEAAVSDLSPHFCQADFRCKCCGQLKVHPRLLIALEELREKAGTSIIILEGHRCPKHNEEAGTMHSTRHIDGTAVDVAASLPLRDLFEIALTIPEFRYGGIGVYPDRQRLHLDTREYGGPEHWGFVDGQKIDARLALEMAAAVLRAA